MKFYNLMKNNIFIINTLVILYDLRRNYYVLFISVHISHDIR